MKHHLHAAKQQAMRYFTADVVPEGQTVRALVASHPGEQWTGLSDGERFLRYELSPASRASASAEQLARACCAGLEIMPFEWWGQPGSLMRDGPSLTAPAPRTYARCGGESCRILPAGSWSC